MIRKTLRIMVVFYGLFFFLHADIGGAKVFIQKLTSEGITVWSKSKEDEQLKKLKEAMNKDFDINYIAEKVVPSELWRYADGDQKDRYNKAFRKMIIQRYSSQFSQYKGQKFELKNSGIDRRPISPRPKGNLYSVATDVLQKGKPPVLVEWKVAEDVGAYKIFDVYIAGISMVDVQANDFNGFAQDQGRKKNAFTGCSKAQDVKKCTYNKLLDDLIARIEK